MLYFWLIPVALVAIVLLVTLYKRLTTRERAPSKNAPKLPISTVDLSPLITFSPTREAS